MLNSKIQLSESLLLCTALLGVLHFSVVVVVVASQIPLDSRIRVADNNNNKWVSSNGNFAIALFQQSGNPNQYSAGIRFDSSSIPGDKQTVVWVAGAGIVVGNESSLHLTPNGELQLIDPFSDESDHVSWASNTANSGVSFGLLRDDGNLVLMNNNNEIVWQSFSTPSETLLPGQGFQSPQTLRASSKKSTTSSFYSLYMTDSGQLELRWQSHVGYWKSGSPSNETMNAVLNTSGVLQILDEKYKVVWSAFGDDHGDDNVRFRFLRLDADGNLRLYSWDEDSGLWRSAWQAVENQCEVFAICGSRGVCVFNEAASAVCKCPFGLTTDAASNCLAPYSQRCDDTATSMVTYEHTSLYGFYTPNDSLVITDLQQCKKSCLEDSNCTAVTFTNDGTARCSMMMTNYITGYSDPSIISVSLVKICSDPMAVLPKNPPPSSYLLPTSNSRASRRLVIVYLIGAALGTLIVVAVAQTVVGVWVYKRRPCRRSSNLRTTFPGLTSSGSIAFTYAEIKELTTNFMYQIRPNLFKGTLQNNQTVMVKQISSCVDEKKFRSTVAIISSIHHKGLTKLEGYSLEQPGHRFLVYEHLKNGTLEKCLRDHKTRKRVLSWRKRVDICLSVGRAVCYLHRECREFISHGNLRCENVVVDENLEAKVTEYGLGEIMGESESLSFSGGPAERDVRDFGMVVLDLLSGTQNTEDSCEWIYEKWVEGKGWSVVDGRTEGGAEVEEVERMLRIAFWCLQGDERMRPSMGEVVKVLEGSLSVDPPPHPFVFHRYSDGDDLVSEEEPEFGNSYV